MNSASQHNLTPPSTPVLQAYNTALGVGSQQYRTEYQQYAPAIAPALRHLREAGEEPQHDAQPTASSSSSSSPFFQRGEEKQPLHDTQLTPSSPPPASVPPSPQCEVHIPLVRSAAEGAPGRALCESLIDEFERFGELVSWTPLAHIPLSLPTGTGFVRFKNPEAAARAVQKSKRGVHFVDPTKKNGPTAADAQRLLSSTTVRLRNLPLSVTRDDVVALFHRGNFFIRRIVMMPIDHKRDEAIQTAIRKQAENTAKLNSPEYAALPPHAKLALRAELTAAATFAGPEAESFATTSAFVTFRWADEATLARMQLQFTRPWQACNIDIVAQCPEAWGAQPHHMLTEVPVTFPPGSFANVPFPVDGSGAASHCDAACCYPRMRAHLLAIETRLQSRHQKEMIQLARAPCGSRDDIMLALALQRQEIAREPQPWSRTTVAPSSPQRFGSGLNLATFSPAHSQQQLLQQSLSLEATTGFCPDQQGPPPPSLWATPLPSVHPLCPSSASSSLHLTPTTPQPSSSAFLVLQPSEVALQPSPTTERFVPNLVNQPLIGVQTSDHVQSSVVFPMQRPSPHAFPISDLCPQQVALLLPSSDVPTQQQPHLLVSGTAAMIPGAQVVQQTMLLPDGATTVAADAVWQDNQYRNVPQQYLPSPSLLQLLPQSQLRGFPQ